MSMPLPKPGVDYVLYNDTGYSFIDRDAPRTINVGIAETTMVGMACGLASQGHKVYCFAHTPHYLRTWEIVRSLLVPRRYNVVLCGIGLWPDYKELGHAHTMEWIEMEQYCDAAGIEWLLPESYGELREDLKLAGPLFIQIPKYAMREAK